jgi:hypothetical protein
MNVSMPDGQVVSFPDDMPHDQIKSMISSKYPDVQKQNVPEPMEIPSEWELATKLVSKALPTNPLTAVSKYATLPAVGNPAGAARAAVDQTAQGGTLGFSDELIDKATSGIVSQSLDMPYDDVYNMARKMSKEQLSKEWKEQPGVSLAAQVAGGYGTGKTIAKALGPLNSLGRGGKAVQNIATTEGMGAAAGAGNADDGKRASGALTGALGATAVSRGIPLAASLVDKSLNGARNIAKGFSAQSPEEVQAAVDAGKNVSRGAYQRMRSAGAVLTPQANQAVVNDVATSIASAGKMNKTMHSGTLGVLTDFAEEARQGPMDIETLDQYRQLFKEVVSKDTDIKGAIHGDGMRAMKAIDAIDDAIENMGPHNIQNNSRDAIEALNVARKEWAKASRTQDIQRIIERSEGDANALKRNLQNFLNKKKNTKGWTAEEINTLKDAAHNTGGELLLKTLGKFGFDLGGSSTPGNTALPAIGLMAGEPMTVVSGTAARTAQKSIARAKAQTLVDMLLARDDPQKINQLLLQQQPVSPAINSVANQSSLLSTILMKP